MQSLLKVSVPLSTSNCKSYVDTVASVSKPHIQGSRLRRPLIRDDVKTDMGRKKRHSHASIAGDREIY